MAQPSTEYQILSSMWDRGILEQTSNLTPGRKAYSHRCYLGSSIKSPPKLIPQFYAKAADSPVTLEGLGTCILPSPEDHHLPASWYSW